VVLLISRLPQPKQRPQSWCADQRLRLHGLLGNECPRGGGSQRGFEPSYLVPRGDERSHSGLVPVQRSSVDELSRSFLPRPLAVNGCAQVADSVQSQLTPDGWELNVTGAPNAWARLQRRGNLKDWEDIWSGCMGAEGAHQRDDGDMREKSMVYRAVVP